jgi:predicted N-acetyltransferase YhbS
MGLGMPLHNTTGETGGPYTLRPCTAAEVASVAAAATALFRAPGTGDMAREYPLLFDEANAAHLWVAERAGTLLAHAGAWLGQVRALGETIPVACFGAVFTQPAARGRGLGSEVLAAAVRAARAAGARLGLVSGSRPLYQRLGFAQIPPTSFVVAGGGSTAPTPLDVAPAREEDSGALADLYSAEPIHFVRSPEDWRRLLACRTVFYGPGHVFVVRAGGRPVAYAAVQGKPTTLPGLGPAFRAVELAGDRAALAAAIPLLRDYLGELPLALVSVPNDEALTREAAARRWPGAEMQLPFSAARWDPTLSPSPIPWYGLNYL